MDAETTAAAPRLRLAAHDARERSRQMLRQIGPWRLLVTLMFLIGAVLFARFSWSVPLADDAERMFYDVRALLASPHVDQDDRVTMVVYTDETLAATGKRSPLDRALLAQALRRLDALHPKGIGIDILIDQAQPEDAELIAAFKTIKTPTYLGFASNATNAEYMQTWQEEFLRNFQQAIAGANVKPTSIRLEADPRDNVMRNWPSQPRELPPLLASSLSSAHPEFSNYRGAIRYRLPRFDDRPVFASLPIDLFGSDLGAEAMRSQIEGRYILIGGDIPGIDQFQTPASRLDGRSMTGLEVHASLLAQLLDGAMLRSIPIWALWVAALLVVALGALTSIADMRPWALGLALAGQLAILTFVPLSLQYSGIDTQGLPLLGWGVGWFLAYSAVGTAARAVGSQQRRFAQSALGKYLPRDIANEIMRDPDRLALHGEKREIYALFSDLEGFTKLSHAIEPEMVAFLLNRYLDVLSEIVLRHGGTIDKFVGDAVVAFWGAPIARPDDADRAVRAAVAMYEAGEAFRREAPEGVPPIGCTRIGLHRGEAIVGNFGGEGRIQYTALGDSMNTAARLESANKQLHTTVLVSGSVRERCTFDYFRPVGRISVSGRSTPIEIFEPVPTMVSEIVTRLTTLHARFDKGEHAALEELERYAEEHPDDAAMANLVYRLKQAGPGGNFVLDSK
jgi:adenylate cyclase